MKLEREFFIPKNAVKIAAKDSSAVAYHFTDCKGRPCAHVFSGKRAKADSRYYYRSDAERAKFTAVEFGNVRAREAYTAERAAERKAKGRGLEVGQIVNTCWGYDQTNYEFFQVTALIGKAMVELREIAQTRDDTHWEQWRCGGTANEFIGEPIRRVAKAGHVKIDDVRHASLWDGRERNASGYA